MTDAAHMLSDFAAFLISLFAIWVAKWQPDKKKTFGYYRAGWYIERDPNHAALKSWKS